MNVAAHEFCRRSDETKENIWRVPHNLIGGKVDFECGQYAFWTHVKWLILTVCVFSSHGNWGLIEACARAALSNQLSKKETFSLFNFPSLLAISVRTTEIEEPVDDMGRIDMISQLYILAQIMFTWDFNNSENLQQSEDRNVELLSCFSFILILI